MRSRDNAATIERDYSSGDTAIVLNRERGLIYWIYVWFPVALGIALVALESQEWFGSNYTSHPLRVLFEAIFGPLKPDTWETIHHMIRKTGHVVGYGLLGLAWLRAWWMTLPHARLPTTALRGLLGTAVVASADEWHQAFLPNRTASAWDVLLDCCGAIGFYLIAYLFMRVYRPGKLTRPD